MAIIKTILLRLVFIIMRIFPIDSTKIVVSNFSGKGYGDNEKAIIEELLRRSNDYKIVWLIDDINAAFPNNIIRVKRLSLRSIYEQSTARIWIDNRRKPSYIMKRKGQFYLQTWHGNTALKKVERDAQDVLTQSYIKASKRDSQMIDLMVTGSRWETQMYPYTFWYDGEIVECGLPRQDILIKHNESTIRTIKEKLGINVDDKVFLYAPTFRNNTSDLSVFNLDFERVRSALSERFMGNWLGIVRLHPNISKLSDKLDLIESVINVTSYPDMQELLLISDCVITDYSSAIIEFGIQKLPGFLFCLDYDDYNKSRSAYFALEDLPFPLAKDNEDLLKAILEFDYDVYDSKWNVFYREMYGMCLDGMASRTLADKIEEAMNA